jgi:hypothetical protein
MGWHDLTMQVLVMDIRKVRMPMPQRFVPMLVNMRLAAVPTSLVLVLMVRVVRVGMAMNQRFMNVIVFVILGKV